MNKKALYESIMKNVAKQVKKALNEHNIIADNVSLYELDPNYDFYADMYKYLAFIMDNLTKLSSNRTPILIKGLLIAGEIPYTHETVGNGFSIGHITGLAIEEALVTCLTTYVNGYSGDHDDIEDIESILGKLGFDISDNINIIIGRDNQPKYDFSMNYQGKTYKILVKAVLSSNAGKNEMNVAIRNGVDMGIIIVYNMLDNDVYIDQIQIYLPDSEGTYKYISKRKLGKRRLRLDPSKSFISFGPALY